MRISKLSVFSGFLLLCGGLFVGCNKPATTTTPPTDAATTAPTVAAVDERMAGQWCYDVTDGTLHLTAVMDYDGKGHVSGNLFGDIQDKAEGDFTTYNTAFEGTLDGNAISVNTTTEIEGDVQEEKQSWTWSKDGKTLNEGRHTMTQVDCEPSPEGE
jgi:hypothetical protein